MARITQQDIADLKLAKGGVETEYGTEAAARYERLAELGYVKEVTLTDRGVAWKLSGDGLKIAYADED
jgi:hypothetical protein